MVCVPEFDSTDLSYILQELYRSPATHKAGWLRFQKYAALVEEIIIDPFVPSAGRPARLLDDTFWCQLASAVGDTPILPHLKAATFRGMSSLIPIDMGLFRLLNPSIQELDFSLPVASDGDLRRLRKALAASLSSTENIRVLSMEIHNLPSLLSIKSLSRSYPRLRSLKLDHGTFVDLCHLRPLTNLPDLEHLSFRLNGYWNPYDPSISFTGLRSLSVSTFDLGDISILLTHVDIPKLQSLSVTETHRDAAHLSHNLPNNLRMLVAKCPCLTSLQWTSNQTWSGRGGYLGNRRSDAPLGELLAPLLAHHTLRCFSMQLRGPIVLYTPVDIRACAEAWPDLETFHIGDSYGPEYGDPAWKRGELYADVESVFAFARHCPRLRSLRLRRIEQFGSGSGPAIGAASLEELAERAPARHLLREMSVDQVFCSTGTGKVPEKERDRRRREFMVRFRGLVMEVFPSATLRIQR